MNVNNCVDEFFMQRYLGDSNGVSFIINFHGVAYFPSLSRIPLSQFSTYTMMNTQMMLVLGILIYILYLPI